jgi:formylglycine-generating enzyme required for sulfatase activity
MRFRDLVISGLFGLSGLLAFGPADAQTLSPGDVFVDCETVCPQMVVIPAGRFSGRGDPESAEDDLGPVTFAKPFAMGRFEITFADWDACVAEGGCVGRAQRQDGPYWDECRQAGRCSPNPVTRTGRPAFDEGWGRGRRPVINVNQADIQLYLDWLSKKTGRRYRLPSAAEWSYAAAAGPEWRAPGIAGWQRKTNMGNYVGRTLPVGAYAPNAFGLFDMFGNVLERVGGCGEAVYTENAIAGCSVLSVYGGFWRLEAVEVILDRPWSFGQRQPERRSWIDGFRVARDL